MSSGERMPLVEAQALAEDLRQLLLPACRTLAIAGSTRRQRATIGDLELVAIPCTRPGQPGLFGTSPPESELWRTLDRLVEEGQVAKAPAVEITCPKCKGAGGSGGIRCERCGTLGVVQRAAPWGDRYRKLVWRGRPVDLFTADEESWGAQFLIRTGPPEYSQAWVTALRGFGLRMHEGYVRRLGTEEVVPVPDEETAHALARWSMVPPEGRDAFPEGRDAWRGFWDWSGHPNITGR